MTSARQHRKLGRLLLGLAATLCSLAAEAATNITDIEFSSRPGSKFEIRLDLISHLPRQLNPTR